MIRRSSLFVIIVILVLVLLGCSPAAATTPQAAASPGAVATRTIVPPPAQPTSATLAPRTPVPFVSPTAALRVQLPSGGASSAPATGAGNPQPTAAAAAPAQPATTGVGPVPTAPGVATGRRSEVKFVFLAPLNEAEEAEPAELVQMRAELKKVPGFLEVTGDEKDITVAYDAGLITIEQLMVKFADLKHPVKRQ